MRLRLRTARCPSTTRMALRAFYSAIPMALLCDSTSTLPHSHCRADALSRSRLSMAFAACVEARIGNSFLLGSVEVVAPHGKMRRAAMEFASCSQLTTELFDMALRSILELFGLREPMDCGICLCTKKHRLSACRFLHHVMLQIGS